MENLCIKDFLLLLVYMPLIHQSVAELLQLQRLSFASIIDKFEEGEGSASRHRIPVTQTLLVDHRSVISCCALYTNFPGSKMAVFWVVAPCSLVEVYQRFRGTCCLHHPGTHLPIRRYNPEDSHLRTHCRENLKSYYLGFDYRPKSLYSEAVLFVTSISPM
jgi:hypothetical protein